jgi:hypothetical protein
MDDMAYDVAMESRPQFVFADARNPIGNMRKAIGEARHGRLLARRGQPIASSSQAAGENAHVIGMACHGEGNDAQIIERLRWSEGRQDPLLAILYHAERRHMDAAFAIDRGEDRLADHRHRG